MREGSWSIGALPTWRQRCSRRRGTRGWDANWIAYQVLGEGPPDLVMTTGSFGHVDMAWEDPGIALFLRTLASFARLIMFDRRGTGASDPLPLDALPHGSPTPKTWLPSWTRSAWSRPPSRAGDQRRCRWFARFQRTIASPRTVQAFLRANLEMDARPILPLIQAPTLVLHRRDCQLVPVAHGRYLAARIAGATFVEFPGTELSLFWETPSSP